MKKLQNIEKFTKDGTYDILSKREKLQIERERVKLERVLGGIADMQRIPAALFIIDVKKEHIAVDEALKLNIPTFAIVDTNSDPTDIDFVIPGNDDATKSVTLICDVLVKAIQEGLDERKHDKENDTEKEAQSKATAEKDGKPAAPRGDGAARRRVKAE